MFWRRLRKARAYFTRKDPTVRGRDDSAVHYTPAEMAILNSALEQLGPDPLLRAMVKVSFDNVVRRASGRVESTSSPGSQLACVIALFFKYSRRFLLMLSLIEAREVIPIGLAGSSGRWRQPRPQRRLGRNGLARYTQMLLRKQSDQTCIDLSVDFKTQIKPGLKTKIGTGAFGSVYKGHWQGKEVAVKMFFKEYQKTGDVQLANFKAKLESMVEDVAVTQASERIVKLYGACLTPPDICIIYEYLSGGSLHDRIHNDQRPLSYLNVVALSRQIAEGLNTLHPNIVHSELNPQNILLDAMGRPKICDKGCCLDFETVGGTPSYMAPEVFTTAKLHCCADVYSMGVIMNEMLTRAIPWQGLQAFQVIYAVSMKQQRPVLAENCPAAFRALIERCWAHDVNMRPRADELVQELNVLYEKAVEADQRGERMPSD